MKELFLKMKKNIIFSNITLFFLVFSCFFLFSYYSSADPQSMEIEEKKQEVLEGHALIVYQEALKLYKDREYKQAREKFVEVQQIVPNFKLTVKYLKKINQKMAQEEERLRQEKQKQFLREVETKYQEALIFYKAGNFIETKTKFIEVESLSPGYKSTLDYLSRIDEDIVQAKEQERERHTQEELKEFPEEIQEQGVEEQKEGNQEAAAPKDFSALSSLADVSQQEEIKKEDGLAGKDQVLEGQVPRELEKLKRKIELAERRLNEEKQKQKDLQRDDRQVPQEKPDIEFVDVDKSLLDLQRIDKNQFKEDKFRQERQKTIEEVYGQKQQEIEEQRKLNYGEFEKRTDQLYQQAKELYQQRNFQESKDLFLEINALKPNYKKTVRYIEKIEKILQSNSQQTTSQQDVLQDKTREEIIAQTLDSIEETL